MYTKSSCAPGVGVHGHKKLVPEFKLHFLQTIFLIHLRFLVQWLDGSMVPWFHGSMVICDCSAVQSAVCLAAAPVFLVGATRHFVLL